MKNIAIFLLVGLSLFGNGYCIEAEVDGQVEGQVDGEGEGQEDVDTGRISAETQDCLVNAIKNSYPLLEKTRDVICKARSGQGDSSSTQEFGMELESVLKNTDCKVKEITGLELDETTSTVSSTTEEILSKLQPILEQVGLTESTTKLLCDLISPLIKSQCLQKLVQNTVPNALQTVLTPAQELSCAAKGDLNMRTVRKALREAMCTLADGLDVKQLEETTKEVRMLIKKDLSNVVDELLSNDALSDTLDDTLCSLKNTLHPVSKVVSGRKKGKGKGGILSVLGR
ncbi:uncharacterized protein LOC130283203 [Hyla sarda]|uniref:uncharacterized protein LOC130283203 n=1 Tax=Hyla sarda TaxID=327740 RepID=UPI0024C43220|nr:uncharacterized protein LOC130283203 [Hyla sarda]